MVTACSLVKRAVPTLDGITSPPESSQHSGVREAQRRASLGPRKGPAPDGSCQAARGTGIIPWDRARNRRSCSTSPTKPASFFLRHPPLLRWV